VVLHIVALGDDRVGSSHALSWAASPRLICEKGCEETRREDSLTARAFATVWTVALPCGSSLSAQDGSRDVTRCGRDRSVRPLSRRLADEGTTYAEVVDELRRTLAHQYLRDAGMSLSQTAWLLG
jgi:hypothetical protein